jgi:hypothetical protein
VTTANSNHKSALALAGQIAWPILLGTALCGVFFAVVFNGPWDARLFQRYFAGHPLAMVETAFFFIGLVALGIKAIEVAAESSAVGRISLGERFADPIPGSQASLLMQRLAELPGSLRESYLGRRLREGLESVERAGSADNLDEELKYLADTDAGKQQDSYSLVRIVIWATPMLGFLGTVVGITDALGNLDPKQLASAPDVAFEGLKNGLYTAFDTTAVALAFSMALMFIQYFIDRLETNILGAVDTRALQELTGWFEQTGAATDPHVQTMKRMGAAVIQASEQLLKKQVDVWQESFAITQEKWDANAQSAGQSLADALSAALGTVLHKHVEQLAQAEAKAADQMQRRWDQWQTALSDNARLLHAHQQELIRQGELMTQAIRVTGDVMQLEHTLNANLAALAGSQNFEDMVLSLSAAINLLNSRLGHVDATTNTATKPAKGKAA